MNDQDIFDTEGDVMPPMLQSEASAVLLALESNPDTPENVRNALYAQRLAISAMREAMIGSCDAILSEMESAINAVKHTQEMIDYATGDSLAHDPELEVAA